MALSNSEQTTLVVLYPKFKASALISLPWWLRRTCSLIGAVTAVGLGVDQMGIVWNPSSRKIILTAWQNHHSNQNEARYLTPSRVHYSSVVIGRSLN